MALINPHTSMMFHDPESKDLNNYKMLGSRNEKLALVKEYCQKWLGKQLHVVNIQSGEVRLWEMRRNPFGGISRHARTNVVHLLFGNWRLATPEDIARQNAKDKVIADQIARVEANKAATKAGIMFSELTKAAAAIKSFEELQEKTKAEDEEKSAPKQKK